MLQSFLFMIDTPSRFGNEKRDASPYQHQYTTGSGIPEAGNGSLSRRRY
jgi:hypothetical protein